MSANVPDPSFGLDIPLQSPGPTFMPCKEHPGSKGDLNEIDKYLPFSPSQSSPTLARQSSNPNVTNEPAEGATELALDRTDVHWKTKWQLLGACLMNLSNGMNDSAPGALIPYIEKDYHIGYAVVSLIFIANALGFITAAPCLQAVEGKLGRCRSYSFSMSLLAIAYIIISCHPPFPATVAAYFMLGFGMAVSIALNNVFCANLANSTTALGCFSGAYGLGGVVSPLFATAMVSSGIHWSLFYTITLAVSVINLLFSGWAFYKFEEQTASISQAPAQSTETPGATSNNESPGRLDVLKMSLKNRTTILGSLFIFAYQGAEVSVSGWVVSFLISYRNGDPSHVGYVSAGFWAGITLGRFLLVYPAHRLGEKISVGVMAAGAIAFQLMTWLIPNVIGEAVAVAILGVLLGAVFPCATAVFTKLLPRRIQISSLSFISALGSSGGAVFPFLTGLLSQSAGTMVLHPICLGLYGAMAACWMFLPRIQKRSD